MLGEASMPYCWAAKSMAKERGATQRAVECGIPILKRFDLKVSFMGVLIEC